MGRDEIVSLAKGVLKGGIPSSRRMEIGHALLGVGEATPDDAPMATLYCEMRDSGGISALKLGSGGLHGRVGFDVTVHGIPMRVDYGMQRDATADRFAYLTGRGRVAVDATHPNSLVVMPLRERDAFAVAQQIDHDITEERFNRSYGRGIAENLEIGRSDRGNALARSGSERQRTYSRELSNELGRNDPQLEFGL